MHNRIYGLGLLVLAGIFATGCASLTPKESIQWNYLLTEGIVKKPVQYKNPVVAGFINLVPGMAELTYLDLENKTPGAFLCVSCFFTGIFSWTWGIPAGIFNAQVANKKLTIKAHLHQIPKELGGDSDIPLKTKRKRTKKPKKIVDVPPDITKTPKDFDPLPEEQRPKLAVFNFVDSSPAGNTDYGRIVADLFHTSLYQTECFRMMEREQIKKIVSEQDLGNTERMSETEAVQIGKLLKVEYILVGSIAKLGTKFIITARVTEVATGKTAAVAPTQKASSADEIDTVVNSMASYLGTKFR